MEEARLLPTMLYAYELTVSTCAECWPRRLPEKVELVTIKVLVSSESMPNDEEFSILKLVTAR